jgi:hypothetical protein
MNEQKPIPQEDPPLLLVGLIIAGLVDALNMRQLRAELYGETVKNPKAYATPLAAGRELYCSSRPDRRRSEPASSA